MKKKHLAALLVWMAAAQALCAMFSRSAALLAALYWCMVTAYWCKQV